MATPIPLNQPPNEILLALLNRDNGSAFTLSQIQFTTLTPMPSTFARNTSIVVEAIPGQGVSSQETVYYNRLDLATQWQGNYCVAQTANAVTTHDLLAPINALYGLNITVDDVEDNPISGNQHAMVATAGSLVWTGSVNVLIVNNELDATIQLVDEFEYGYENNTTGFVYSANNDYDKDHNTLLYEMVTQWNASGQPYNASHFLFSDLIATAATSSATITATAQGGSGFEGTADIVYTRIALNMLLSPPALDLDYFLDLGYSEGQVISDADMLTYINSTFNVQFSSTDLTFSNAVTVEGQSVNITATDTNVLAWGNVVMSMQVLSVGISDYQGGVLIDYNGNVISPYNIP